MHRRGDARLDRIELSQITEPEKAMGRFHTKRGDSLYMFYVEADDVAAIASRLEKQSARFAAGRRDEAGLSGIFIHPTAFCGVLVGVSRTENAWLWSGDPERAPRRRRPSRRDDNGTAFSATLTSALSARRHGAGPLSRSSLPSTLR